jgi:hypothetical protein
MSRVNLKIKLKKYVMHVLEEMENEWHNNCE